MLGRKLFRSVRPYFSAMAVIATACVLVFTIYFTQLSLQWTAFLTGVLVAAILAETTRVSRAEWVVMRRTTQLSSLKEKLERESYLREQAEKMIAADKSRLHLLDEELSTMIALIDKENYCRYHNRAFREWLHLRPEQINNRHLREILGSQVCEEIQPQILRALNGKATRYDRKMTMPDGALYHLSIEYVPQFEDDGNVSGLYILADDITEHRDVLASSTAEFSPTVQSHTDVSATAAGQDEMANQDMFIDSMYEQITGHKDSGERIIEAIEHSEFRLFYQLITPLSSDSRVSRHYEILIRLKEEEESMMPPGAFFPLAEKHALMPLLDRWVVQHVLEWTSSPHRQDFLDDGSMFFLNLSSSTLHDPGFPDFIQKTLLEYGMPGSLLCFEIPSAELAQEGTRIAQFIQAVRGHGCRAALSGFGRDAVSFNLIRGFQIEFLKIDSSLILNLHRDPVSLAKTVAINRVAKKIGVRTIAEFAESEETIVKLTEVGIDFAQGFGISKPCAL